MQNITKEKGMNVANTYTQIYIQTVFTVENKISLIKDSWREELHKYVTGIVQNKKHKLIVINSMPDHIHIFIGMKPIQSVSSLLQDIKDNSSKWINKQKLVLGKFKWQAGYGAFSYSHSQIDRVAKCIMNQEKHHKKKSFREKYVQLLKRFNITYEEQFMLKDI